VSIPKFMGGVGLALLDIGLGQEIWIHHVHSLGNERGGKKGEGKGEERGNKFRGNLKCNRQRP